MRYEQACGMNAPDPYWQHDLSLGNGVFPTVPRGIRMLLHVATEHSLGMQEIVPLPHRAGMRTVVHARPYIRRSRSWLGNLIRRVLASPVPDIPYQTLGDCQAWYYHTDRVLILWDCYLSEPTDPRTDHNLSTIWHGFEHFLLALFPDTIWIATPSWEPVYETKEWQAFLTKQGYQLFNTQAFLKEVHSGE
jgi:hypothetical protein